MDRDEQEFTAVYASHYEDVLRYAVRRVGPDQVADIAAETFAVAWRRLEKVPLQQPLPWLYAVARNMVSNVARRDQRRGEVLTPMDGPAAPRSSHPDHAESVIRRQATLHAFQGLREDEKELVMLIAWEGLDMPSVAKVLDCSAAAAYIRLHRARKRLERLMENVHTGVEVNR
ncbi:RNA polymerase sigma factor [Salinactinospora qingdaonensis]|uniref:RNA polymerase sigma factor n=1 Tax=Salinactinospora qingdaonensis TaxID=702744 RepID=A0ABP7GEB9_9ACTN